MLSNSKFLLIFVLVPERHLVFLERVLKEELKVEELKVFDAIKKFLDITDTFSSSFNDVIEISTKIWDERFMYLYSFIGKKIENYKSKLEALKAVPPMKSLLFRLHGRCSYGEGQSFSGNIGYD